MKTYYLQSPHGALMKQKHISNSEYTFLLWHNQLQQASVGEMLILYVARQLHQRKENFCLQLNQHLHYRQIHKHFFFFFTG